MDKDLSGWSLDENEFATDWGWTAIGVAVLLKQLAALEARVAELEDKLANK
jgi:hypothetical protein